MWVVRERKQSSVTSRFSAWVSEWAVELSTESSSTGTEGDWVGDTRTSVWDMRCLGKVSGERPKRLLSTHFESSYVKELYTGCKSGSPENPSAT